MTEYVSDLPVDPPLTPEQQLASDQLWAVIQEKIAAFRLKRDGPPEPQWSADVLLPDLGSSYAPSESAQRVNDACDSITIFEVYDRLSKGHYDNRRAIETRDEGIQISCPIPGHRDSNPSAAINKVKQVWMCYACDQGGDKYTIAGYAYELDPKTQFPEIKRRLAKEFRGVTYEKPSPRSAVIMPREMPSPEQSTPGTSDGDRNIVDLAVPANTWEAEVEEQKYKTLVRLEGDHRARQERAAGLFEPPTFVDTLEAELALPDPDIEWTIDGLHAVGGNTTITAGFKVGKTTFVMNLIKALADQERFLGEKEVRSLVGRVALWNFEVDQVQMKRNFRELALQKPANVWHLPLRGHSLNLMDDAAYRWALAELRRQEIEVLVLDPFSGVYFGDENDNSQINAFTKRLDQLKREAGVADLFMPVHTGRVVEEGNERARGGAKLDDWTDNRWVLSKSSKTGDRYFRAEGRRVDQAERELRFVRETNSLTYSSFAGTRGEKAVRVLRSEVLAFISANPGCSKGQIETGASGKAEAIRAVVKKLVDDHDVVVRHGSNRTQHHYVQGQQPMGYGP